MTSRPLLVRCLTAARVCLALLGHLAIAVSGAAAAYGLVLLAYRLELARVRHYWPGARLCAYGYQQAAMWLVPLGAAAALLLSAWLLDVWHRRRATRALAEEHGDGMPPPAAAGADSSSVGASAPAGE